MFFHNQYYYNFIKNLREKGVEIPIVPGIIPITDLGKIEKFASLCKVTIPQKIKQQMLSIPNNPEKMREIGIEFTINQCQDLIKNDVKIFHFFTLNHANNIKDVLDNLNY